jgi:hypothetical protein
MRPPIPGPGAFDTATPSAQRVGISNRVHIDRIVLHGVPVEPCQLRHFEAALTAELARLLSGHALLPGASRSREPARATAASFRTGRDFDPDGFGRQIAASLCRELV